MLPRLQMIRQFFQTAWRKLSRRLLHLRMRGRPEAEILAAERRLRGVEQYTNCLKFYFSNQCQKQYFGPVR